MKIVKQQEVHERKDGENPYRELDSDIFQKLLLSVKAKKQEKE